MLTIQRKEHSQQSNMEVFDLCFGVVLQPLLLGALNLCVALYNWVITEVFFGEKCCIKCQESESLSKVTGLNRLACAP